MRGSNKQDKIKRMEFYGVCILSVFTITAGFLTRPSAQESIETVQTSRASSEQNQEDAATPNKSQSPPTNKQVARITASGDMLYHDIVYGSAFDGNSYDFKNDYEQITPLVSSADLAIGDFEGTINPNKPLAGYPLFNAPEEVIQSIKDAGYDVLDLAHNHILDTGIEGLKYTANAFRKNGLDIFGVKVDPSEGILVKEVNGIKVAILGFAYGFNGIEATLTDEEYNNHLYDLNMQKVKQLIQRAEEIADFTIVLPQMGEEYHLHPTQGQIDTYHQMIEWGADVIFGGHPHVIEPTETITIDGEKKFIIYSMGNLLSNQRVETLENIWTERGVIMDITIEKENGKTTLTSVKAHPTWVSRTEIDRSFMGGPAYDYQVFLAENYMPGGPLEHTVDKKTLERIQSAYTEVNKLLNIKF